MAFQPGEPSAFKPLPAVSFISPPKKRSGLFWCTILQSNPSDRYHKYSTRLCSGQGNHIAKRLEGLGHPISLATTSFSKLSCFPPFHSISRKSPALFDNLIPLRYWFLYSLLKGIQPWAFLQSQQHLLVDSRLSLLLLWNSCWRSRRIFFSWNISQALVKWYPIRYLRGYLLWIRLSLPTVESFRLSSVLVMNSSLDLSLYPSNPNFERQVSFQLRSQESPAPLPPLEAGLPHPC
jgi:hypothetical protein